MTGPVPGIHQVTEAQIVAARLRRMAADLIREAEALEATAPRRQVKQATKPSSMVELARQQGVFR